MERELYDACVAGNVGMVRYIIYTSWALNRPELLRIDALTYCTFTPLRNFFLHGACLSGNPEVVDFLCQMGADVRVVNILMDTPLHLATFAGHRSIMRRLIGLGADVNAANYRGTTPLHFATNVAIGSGDVSPICTLLEFGAKIARDKFGVTPLSHACISGGGKEEVIDNLLDNQDFSKVEDNVQTLREVLRCGRTSIALRLLSHTRSSSQRFEQLLTVLMLAQREERNIDATFTKMMPVLEADSEWLPGGVRSLLDTAVLHKQVTIQRVILCRLPDTPDSSAVPTGPRHR